MAVALTVALPDTGSADSGSFRGSAQAGYQRVERDGVGQPLEAWVKSVETGYGRSLPGEITFSSRLRFAEQTIVGRRDRARTPEGGLRLSHRYFGLSASYQPTESRDSRNVTTRQRTLAFTANAQKPGLPSVTGSWARNSSGATSGGLQGSASVARSLGASYNVSNLAVRAGYGDRSFAGLAGATSGLAESHVSLGSSLHFQAGRAPVSMQYDFGQSRANRNGLPSVVGIAHTAGVASSFAFSTRTSAALGYGYQRAETRGGFRSATDDHNGSLALSHRLTPGVQMSTGGGVRAARIGGRSETESFAAASISAAGQARPGWRMAASAGRSYNWLPGEHVRAADDFQSSTSLRLANGLDAYGRFSVTASRRSDAAADSAQSLNRVGVQTAGGFTARPLRTVSLGASVSHNATGPSLWNTISSTTSYSADMRLAPAQRLQLAGGWSLSAGAASRGTTERASATLALGSRMQASAGYNRSRQRMLVPIPSSPRPQESASGTLSMALGRKMNASFRYGESAWGRPGHVRQMNVDVVRSFGR